MLPQFYITFITIIRLRDLLEREEHRVSREAMQNHDMDATLLSICWVMWKNDTLAFFIHKLFYYVFLKNFSTPSAAEMNLQIYTFG
jgi:hypothetical protein